MATEKPVRLAIVGGGRGSAYCKSLDAMPEKVELVALCDPNELVQNRWREMYPQLRTTADLADIADDDSIDAVLLATPLMMHAPQAVALMEAGKHILSEVAAAHTVEGCWQLIEAVEKTKRKYMLAENFCYLRTNLLVKNMVEQGAFGELTHAECAYVHDVRGAMHDENGGLLWRGELVRDFNGINYPTHSIGPVMQWLGIHRGDELESLVAVASKPASQADYFRERFGAQHPGAQPDFWKQGDSVLSLMHTKNGAVIYIRNDFSSPRPCNYRYYSLQGTRGAFETGREITEEPVAWLQSSDAMESPLGQARWQPLESFAGKYEHPVWQKDGALADTTGTLSECFVIQEFIAAIQEDRAPAIDVYDAATMSSVFPLSAQSIEQKGAPVSFPDFARNKPAAPSV